MFTKLIKNIKNIYTICGKLGTTGNSYLIVFNESQKQFVAKIYDEWETDQDQQSFLNELDFRVNEKHPELMAIRALNLKDFYDENHPTIITDYMENGSLEDNFNVLTKTQKYILLYAISDCLEFLHKNKILHLNLNPKNILLDPQYYPRITDYYCFKTHKLREKIARGEGLSLYMAPEVINHQTFGPKADVFSFGIIAYEILTNQRASSNTPNFTLINNVHLRDIISKCISNDPKERPTFSEIKNSLDDKEIKDDMDVKFRDFQSYFNFQSLEMARKGDPEAMNRIGCLRECAHADIDEVLFYYDGAIEKGNGNAMFNKSSMLYFGRNCQKNIDEAVKLMKMAADHDNTYAMANLGSLTFYGVGIPKDTDDGLFYLNLSKKKGNPYAMYILGDIYLNGYSVPANIEKGLQLIKDAANLGHVRALVTLAYKYRYGKNVPRDIDEAIRLLKLAIEKYSNEARCDLADIYANEESVKNEEEAFRLLEEAIKDGYTQAVNQKQDLINHRVRDGSKDDEGDFINVGYIDFFDGLPIEKPKFHHIKYLKKSDFKYS